MNRRLYRCREDRAIAGVAAGVAEYLGLDPTLVRVLWFVSIFFGGVTFVLYVGLALIVPLEPDPAAAAADGTAMVPDGHRHVARGSGRLTTFIGSILIVIGAVALVDLALPGWASWRQLWPLVFITIGGLLIFFARRRAPSES